MSTELMTTGGPRRVRGPDDFGHVDNEESAAVVRIMQGAPMAWNMG